MTQQQWYEVRERSYRVPPASDDVARGEGIIKPGDVAYVRYAHGPLVAGTCVRVLRYMNAGFNGIEAYVTLDGTRPYNGAEQVPGDRCHVSAGNLDPVDPAITAAIADGRIEETEDDMGAVCYAPAEGDGVTAEIFRLWVDRRELGGPGFYVLNAAADFAVTFSSDTDVEGAIAALLAGHATTHTRGKKEERMTLTRTEAMALSGVLSRAHAAIVRLEGTVTEADLLADLHAAFLQLRRIAE